MTINDMEGLLKKSIAVIQEELRKMDKIESVTAEDLKDLLKLEKLSKNRRTLIGWLEVGVMSGELPGEFYLDYQGKVGLYKSALQKYIRRGMVEKAVRAAKTLFLLGKDQAIRRLKIIAVEDAFSAVEVLKFFHDGMSLKEFLQVTAVIAEAPKDKTLCSLGWQLTEGLLASQVNTTVPDTTWLRYHLLDKQEYVAVMVQLFKLAKDKRYAEIYEIFQHDQDAVVKQCLDRVVGGTFWESDSALLLSAAIRYKRGDYALKGITLPSIDENAVQRLPLAEIDPFCIDFHTHIGRIAERFFLARHREIPQKILQSVWFHGESALLGGEIIADWIQPYDKRLWERIRPEIQQIIEDLMFKKFKLRELDQAEALRWSQR